MGQRLFAIASVVACLLSASTTSMAAMITIFNGSGMPTDQGWTLYHSNGGTPASGPEPIVVTQIGGDDSDTLSVETQGSTIYKFRYDAGESALLASIRVAVYESTHNFGDAGFYFSVIHSKGAWGPDRANSVFIDPDRIGFMNSGYLSILDEYSLDATQFREYSILYTAEHLMQVYVDTPYSDIINQTASPILSRQMYSEYDFDGINIPEGWDDFMVGSISFGDMTNDRGVNSRYEVDYVRYENLGILDQRPPPPDESGGSIPEPGILVLLSLGLAGLVVSRPLLT